MCAQSFPELNFLPVHGFGLLWLASLPFGLKNRAALHTNIALQSPSAWQANVQAACGV